MSKHCWQCGKETITQCQECSVGIRGEYVVPDVVVLGGGYKPPNFCYNCGEPFPWTRAKLDAAYEIADELDELNEEEKEKLKKSVIELAQDSPQAEVASIRYKKLIKKTGEQAASPMNNIMKSLATEAITKYLGI